MSTPPRGSKRLSISAASVVWQRGRISFWKVYRVSAAMVRATAARIRSVSAAYTRVGPSGKGAVIWRGFASLRRSRAVFSSMPGWRWAPPSWFASRHTTPLRVKNRSRSIRTTSIPSHQVLKARRTYRFPGSGSRGSTVRTGGTSGWWTI